MWWVDLMALVYELDEITWTNTDENIARLLDRDDFYLNSEYQSWITDPDDPEVKRARAQRKRAGIKPPPKPVLVPVAKRPAHAQREAESQVLVGVEESKPKKKKGTIAQLREMYEL